VELIKFIVDILTPRFITEEVAVLVLENGDYQPICQFIHLRPGEYYDKKVTIRTFNFFGFGLFPKLIKEE